MRITQKAIKNGCDFIVPFNGIIGNAISRALWLVDNRRSKDKAKLISLHLLTDTMIGYVKIRRLPKKTFQVILLRRLHF